jgi:hypothetical protein
LELNTQATSLFSWMKVLLTAVQLIVVVDGQYWGRELYGRLFSFME